MNRSTPQEGRAMQEGRLLNAIFELVERFTKAELTNSGRRLLIEYFRTCPENTAAGRARGAIRRYAQWDPPSMDEVRERHRAGAMEDLDWRVLKVENEARKLEEADGQALISCAHGKEAPVSSVTFPHDFIWGAATASYQLEGGVTADGRGETIWDRFSHTPGAIRTGEVGDVACDHYRLFAQDVGMIKEMGHRGYRFSIAWSRVYPEGRGKLNTKGLDFYESLVDTLLEKGILPFITLYHWDLPQALQDRGGWGNRDTADYYADYAAAVFQALGDRVKHWITHNEPWCTAYLGHAEGIHAPGLRDFALAVNASHHVLLSHAKAVVRFREMNRGGRIGITLNLWPNYAASDSPRDQAAVRAADGHHNRWFLDPVFRGVYPDDMLELYRHKRCAPEIAPGDMDLMAKGGVDFLGVNYYMRHIVAHSDTGRLGYEMKKLEKAQFTEMGWEVYPEGLYDLLARVDRDYGHPEMYITENGIACRDDRLVNGRVEDDDRIAYLRDHFVQAHRLIQSGVKLRGYFIWTLMDCFEWQDGFSMKFGLAGMDPKTLERKPKKSALWFRDVIRTDGLSED